MDAIGLVCDDFQFFTNSVNPAVPQADLDRFMVNSLKGECLLHFLGGSQSVAIVDDLSTIMSEQVKEINPVRLRMLQAVTDEQLAKEQEAVRQCALNAIAIYQAKLRELNVALRKDIDLPLDDHNNYLTRGEAQKEAILALREANSR